MIDCPHCDRTFGQANDAYQHIRVKHGGKKARTFRAEHLPQHLPENRERSIGEELGDAMLAAAMGEDVPEHIALMFPDEVAEARRR